jgi:hypothetical protein
MSVTRRDVSNIDKVLKVEKFGVQAYVVNLIQKFNLKFTATTPQKKECVPQPEKRENSVKKLICQFGPIWAIFYEF